MKKPEIRFQDPLPIARLLLWHLVFFENCPDTELDPDTAVKMGEQFIHMVNKELATMDKLALLELAEQMAAEDTRPAVQKVLRHLRKDVDLPPAAAA